MSKARFLRLGVLLAVVLTLLHPSALSHAQNIDWSDPYSALLDHPEIIQQVFSAYGIPNGSPNAYEYTEARTCDYFPSGDPNDVVWNDFHTQSMIFTNGAMSPLPENYDEYITLVSDREYDLEGMRVRIAVTSHSAYTENWNQYGSIELVPGSGEYFAWDVRETCTATFGNNMPAMQDLIATFLQTLRQWGFKTPAELSTAPDEPTPTPNVIVEEALPDTTHQEPMEPAAADEMDPSMVPGMAGSVAVGTLAGIALAQGISALTARRRAAPLPPKAAVHYSPATGKPAPLEQVQEEQAKMAAGYYYRDGQWHAPSGEYSAGPSMLSREYEQEKAARQEADQERWARERAARRKEDIQFDMELNANSARVDSAIAARLDTAVFILNSVEIAADVGVSALSVLPGGRVVKKAYEAVKNVSVALMEGYVEGSYSKVATSLAEGYLAGKIADKTPGMMPRGARSALLKSQGRQAYKAVAQGGRALQNGIYTKSMAIDKGLIKVDGVRINDLQSSLEQQADAKIASSARYVRGLITGKP